MSWFGDVPSAMWGRAEDDLYDEEDPYEDPTVTRERMAQQWYRTHHPEDHAKAPKWKVTNVKRTTLKKSRPPSKARSAKKYRRPRALLRRPRKRRSLFDLLWN